ncbi:MAG: hypothetical protein CMO80_06340 [Verrucomicrobiales bacterium]|nr:hypothetical protein [Verrucomicrobiales bacterium]|tara:strand:+ start:717 stop:1403 length:687 start_codon:yes stop_codon:yes gene_type:complete
MQELDSSVHVWLTSGLEAPDADPVALRNALIDEEQNRFDRFHFDVDRIRFARSRIFLRNVLGSYLNSAPTDIRFDYGEFRKPRIAPEESLQFSFSRSGDVALVGLSSSEIGADVERVRELPDWEGIVRSQFSSRENEFLLSAESGIEEFFEVWTGKEAFIKGTGRGLQCPLDGFSVVPTGTELRAVEGPESDGDWLVANLESALKGYHAAVAQHGKWLPIQTRNWVND